MLNSESMRTRISFAAVIVGAIASSVIVIRLMPVGASPTVKVWFAADELWQTIRKTRFTTEKNPFHYHRNYSRLKALRLQLKYSVPEPTEKFRHIKKCTELFNTRKILLDQIEENGFLKLSFSLQAEMISLPNFEIEK